MKFLIIFFILVSCHLFAQDTIQWRQDYKLRWEDFQDKPDATSQHAAISSAGISFNLSFNEEKFSYKVNCIFYKKRSWTKSNDPNLLMHEKGHFDIAEIFARKLRKVFSEYIFNYKTIKQDFDRMFLANSKERDVIDSLYDRETDFSRNKVNQQNWNNKIKAELKKLDAYKE